MNPIKKLGKETLIYGTSTVLARLLNFCLVPFYTYYLVTADYGVVATVFAFLALFNVVYQYGMDQAYLRFTSESGQDKRESFSTAFLSVLATSTLLSVIIYFTSGLVAGAIGIGAEFGYLIKLCCAVLFLDSLTVIPFAKLRLEHRAWRFVGVRTAGIVVNVAANIYFLAYAGAGLAGIFYASILASAVSIILLGAVIFEDLKPKFSKILYKDMLRFAWPFVPSGMASILVNVVDKPLLVYLAGLSAVGVYQANFKIGVFMMLIVSMFDTAWRPFFLQQAKQPNAKEIYARVLTCFTAVALWAVLGLSLLMPIIIQTKIFGHYFIHPSYWGGLKIIPLVLVGYFFYGMYINFMVAPVLTKKTKVLMFATLLGAAVSVSTNIILVPRIGITGAGAAILLSYISMAACLYIFMRRNYLINYEYKKLGLMCSAAVAGGVICAVFPALWVKILVLIIFPISALKITFPEKFKVI